MLRVHLSPAAFEDLQNRLQALIARPTWYDDYAITAGLAEDLLASVPDHAGVWPVPDWAEHVVTNLLRDHPDVAQAVHKAELKRRQRAETHLQQTMVARRLFDAWTGATNPEILSTLWHNLSPSDRQYWLDRAAQHLAEIERD